MKTLLSIITKAVIFLAVFYFGLIMLMDIPGKLHEQEQENYQAIFTQPQTKAKNFETWTKTVRAAIKADQTTDFIKHTAVYLLMPSMREKYQAYYQDLLAARADYKQIITKLEKIFATNQALKRTWEVTVLPKNTQKSKSLSNWGSDLYKLLANPSDSSDALLSFVQFNQQKAILVKQLNSIGKQVKTENPVLQIQLITK